LLDQHTLSKGWAFDSPMGSRFKIEGDTRTF
jgi:hypothetical protein